MSRSTSAILDVLESRRGTNHEPTNAGWSRSVSSLYYYLAALSAASRTDTETNGTQSVVVLDCVVSFGDFHWSVDISVCSVACRGQTNAVSSADRSYSIELRPSVR